MTNAPFFGVKVGMILDLLQIKILPKYSLERLSLRSRKPANRADKKDIEVLAPKTGPTGVPPSFGPHYSPVHTYSVPFIKPRGP